MSYIYLTTNLINGKKYIGQRRKDSEGDCYLGSGTYLSRAINKYGVENFKKEIIVEGNFNNHLLNDLEKHYIQLHAAVISNKYYNKSPGGHSAAKEINMKYVYVYNKDGEEIDFLSVQKASIKYGIKPQQIYKSSNHGIWSYKNKLLFSYTQKEVGKFKHHQHAKMYVFNLKGELVKEVNGLDDLHNFLGVSKVQCVTTIRKSQIVKRKYLVSKYNNFNELRPTSERKKVIFHYDSAGNLINTFTFGTLQAMYVLGISSNKVSKLCMTERYSKSLDCFLSYRQREFKKYTPYQSRKVESFNNEINIVFDSIKECSEFFKVTDKTVTYRIGANKKIGEYNLKYV